MRNIAVISLLTLVVICGLLAYALAPSAHYGAAFKGAPLVSLDALVAGSDRYLAADVRVRGKIVRQCPAAGCWFFLEEGKGPQLRVELGHLGLTFPQRIGHLAEVEGRLLKSGNDLEFVGNGVSFEEGERP